jgi:hypothetical protein
MSAPAFPPNSRYAGFATAELVQPDGTRVACLRRRLVPDPARYATVLEHRVLEGERLDRLAAAYLGDPELFWRMADANGLLDPVALEEVNRRVRLTLPEGMAGPDHA